MVHTAFSAGSVFLWGAVLCLLVHVATFAVIAMRSVWQPKGMVAHPHRQGVTILRPVAGLENNLERTLRSAFELAHDKIEIIFCAARADDPVIPLVERIRVQYPDIPSFLLVGDDRVSSNPKLNNLVKGWQAARHDWIVMADSNVLMPKDYLARLFGGWGKDTGLVTSPPVGTEPENLAAELEAAFLNSYQARWQLCADCFGKGFAQGKTLFWRREVLENAGGITALAEEPAEDAASTRVVRRQGLRVRLAAMPFAQPLGMRRFRPVWDRQVRWAKLRHSTFPLFFYLEIVSGLFFPLLCLLVAALCGSISFAAVAGFLLVWYAVEVLVTYKLGWPCSPRQWLAMAARDLLLPVLWVAALGKGGVEWQGHAIGMGKEQVD